MNELINEARLWCEGKQWWWRLLLLIWFGILFIHHLADPAYKSVLHLLNLPIHEMGHMIFGVAGYFWHMIGGTLLQLAAPILALWNFYIQRDFFAMALCFGWLSTNFFDVAAYMADARSMQIILVTVGGGDPVHDWNYLFGRAGMLPYDHIIAGFVWLLAVICMLICFTAGLWLFKNMAFK